MSRSSHACWERSGQLSEELSWPNVTLWRRLAGRFGLSTRLGMTSLVLTERQRSTTSDLAAHLQQLPGGLDVLVAPIGADSAMSLDRELGSSPSLIASDRDLIADCGRLVPGALGQQKIIRDSDRTILLVRPDIPGVAHAKWSTNWIQQLSSGVASVVMFGAGDARPAEVSDELGLRVLGVVPDDRRAASMACGAPGTAKHFIRSELVAFARELVTKLHSSQAGHTQ